MGMFDTQSLKFHRLWISAGGYGINGTMELKNNSAEIEFKLSDITIERILKLISEDDKCKEHINNSLTKSLGINLDKWSLNG
jgi:hypothetical protein